MPASESKCYFDPGVYATKWPKTSMATMLKAIRLMPINASKRFGAVKSKNTSSCLAPCNSCKCHILTYGLIKSRGSHL